MYCCTETEAPQPGREGTSGSFFFLKKTNYNRRFDDVADGFKYIAVGGDDVADSFNILKASRFRQDRRL